MSKHSNHGNLARLLRSVEERPIVMSGCHIDRDQSLVATQTIYFCAQALVKFSILILYHRLFGVNRLFRIALFTAGALTAMWWIAAFLDSILECVPVQAIWDQNTGDHRCQNIRASALGTGIANMILDIVVLTIPLPMIWNLQVTRRIKISLTGIFLLGALYVNLSHSKDSFSGAYVD